MITVEELFDTDDDLSAVGEKPGGRHEMLDVRAASRDLGEALRVFDAICVAGGDEIVACDLAVHVERAARRVDDGIEEQRSADALLDEVRPIVEATDVAQLVREHTMEIRFPKRIDERRRQRDDRVRVADDARRADLI
ncbi:MAG TPA: hypothetical protein VFF43_15930 [Caldimonas sp.]|nr:hypothetical protein [Caldimonas sp.]